MQMFDIGKELQKAYDEGYVRGVEDFAEKLKQMPSVMNCEYEWLHIDIDNLLKEMTEKEGGKG